MNGSRGDQLVRVIGALKLAKGLLLVMAGVATLFLLHGDVEETVRWWAWQLHVDPGGRHVKRIVETVAGFTPRRIVAISAGMFFYAALLLTEGTGLLLRKRWAEYFTIVVTGSFVPLEIVELTRRLTPVRLGVTALNVLIVGYLAVRRWQRATPGTGGGRTSPSP